MKIVSKLALVSMVGVVCMASPSLAEVRPQAPVAGSISNASTSVALNSARSSLKRSSVNGVSSTKLAEADEEKRRCKKEDETEEDKKKNRRCVGGFWVLGSGSAAGSGAAAGAGVAAGGGLGVAGSAAAAAAALGLSVAVASGGSSNP